MSTELSRDIISAEIFIGVQHGEVEYEFRSHKLKGLIAKPQTLEKLPPLNPEQIDMVERAFSKVIESLRRAYERG